MSSMSSYVRPRPAGVFTSGNWRLQVEERQLGELHTSWPFEISGRVYEGLLPMAKKLLLFKLPQETGQQVLTWNTCITGWEIAGWILSLDSGQLSTAFEQPLPAKSSGHQIGLSGFEVYHDVRLGYCCRQAWPGLFCLQVSLLLASSWLWWGVWHPFLWYSPVARRDGCDGKRSDNLDDVIII